VLAFVLGECGNEDRKQSSALGELLDLFLNAGLMRLYGFTRRLEELPVVVSPYDVCRVMCRDE